MSNNFFARLALIGLAVVVLASGCGSAADETVVSPQPSQTSTQTAEPAAVTERVEAMVTVGAARLVAEDFVSLQGRRVGLITNEAATVDGRPLYELLAEAATVDLVAVFAPEHGIRALDPAGAAVTDGHLASAPIEVYSLYGERRAPTAESLAGLDVLVFDLQDVGVRAYTYLATMGLAMAAAAEADVDFMVLDRPNPLGGHMVDGFVREPTLGSFIAQYPVPAVHGLSAGEMALIIKGEGWLDGLTDLDLEVVEMHGWRREERWPQTGLDWLPPSPSLPTVDSVLLYPATVLFEATSLSLGRGTPEPFTVLGGPWVDGELVAATLNELGLPGVGFEATTFTPTASPSVPDPPLADQAVPGIRIVVNDIDALRPAELGLHLIEVFWRHGEDQGVTDFLARPEVLDLLAGSRDLRDRLAAGDGAASIVTSWAGAIAAFDAQRQPYLLYS